MGRRKKKDTQYFQQIPKEIEVMPKDKDPKEVVLANLKERYKLKQEREFLKEQKKEIIKKVYNLSMKINDLDEDNETIMFNSGLLQKQ